LAGFFLVSFLTLFSLLMAKGTLYSGS